MIQNGGNGSAGVFSAQWRLGRTKVGLSSREPWSSRGSGNSFLVPASVVRLKRPSCTASGLEAGPAVPAGPRAQGPVDGRPWAAVAAGAWQPACDISIMQQPQF